MNYKKLNQISSLSQLPISRVDQVLDSLEKGRSVFLLRFGLLAPPDYYGAQEYRPYHGDLFTPTCLYEWFFIPQGSSASPGCFVKAINEVIKGLTEVVAYFDDVIGFDYDSTALVKTI